MDYEDFEAKLKARVMEGVPPTKRLWREAWAPPFAGLRSPNQELSGLPKAVYFIVVGDVVKIGVSSDLPKRILALKTALAHPIDASYRDEGFQLSEKSLHERFKAHRLQGEWFILADEIKEFIEDCRKDGILADHQSKGQKG